MVMSIKYHQEYQLTSLLKADDTDPGATVSLQSIGVPLGASIVLSNQNTNSITGNFSWVPTANNLGTNVINF